jgi:hypothetical protein
MGTRVASRTLVRGFGSRACRHAMPSSGERRGAGGSKKVVEESVPAGTMRFEHTPGG